MTYEFIRVCDNVILTEYRRIIKAQILAGWVKAMGESTIDDALFRPAKGHRYTDILDVHNKSWQILLPRRFRSSDFVVNRSQSLVLDRRFL